MPFVYDFIFLLIALFFLPLYAIRKKFHRGFYARLGIVPPHVNLEYPIWVHAVSVGEAMMLRSLLEALRARYPAKRFVISTVTPTGNEIAQAMARKQDFVTYLPLDLSFLVRRVVRKIKPSLFIIAETELWPNLITCLYDARIPIAVVNARISDSSFRGYRLVKFLLAPVLKKVTLFSAQTKRDKERLMALGVSEEKIRVCGNMKFDIERGLMRDDAAYRLNLRLGPADKLFVAGSTHRGEEGIVLEAYKGCLEAFPNTRLLIAPRHPERTQEIQKLILKGNLKFVLLSRPRREAVSENCGCVYILDVVGQLRHYYAIADVVFVGGSLVKKGGHNILEPAIFSKPILCGPHMFNFRDITSLFLENHACIIIHNKIELLHTLKGLFQDFHKAEALGMRAQEVIAQNQGATQRTAECLIALGKIAE